MPTHGNPLQCLDRLKKASCTRYLKVWHDHSEIAEHGHLLVLVAALYDPASYYTDQEMLKRGKSLNVEALVEHPYIRPFIIFN